MLAILGNDPSSCIAAGMAGWAHPVDRPSLILMDLYDLQHASKVKKTPKAYPRPWLTSTKEHLKPSIHLTQDEIVAALRAAGHSALLPGEAASTTRPRDDRGRFVKVG